MSDKFQILTLSGGGIKGLYTARMLAHWEESELGGEPIGNRFDLIAGTSIGGIIACAVAAHIPMREVVKLFEEQGQHIFRKKWFANFSNLFKPRYEQNTLRSAIETLIEPKLTLGELQRPLLIPAFNMTTGKLKVFKSPYKSTWINDKPLSVVDVALATAAAPTFFRMAKLDDGKYVDGGICANSPDLMALHEATHFLGQKASSISVLSLGTTTKSIAIGAKTSENIGILGWMVPDKKLIEVFMAGQEQLSQTIVKQKIGEDSYTRIDWDCSSDQQVHLKLDSATPSVIESLSEIGLNDAKTHIFRFQSFLDHTPKLRNNA